MASQMTYRWQEIVEKIRLDIASGRYSRGSRLPTEAALAASFGANRHTVRRALALLRDEGLVNPRQGSGVFVTGQPRAYRLRNRTRFSQTLERQGEDLEMIVLGIENRQASEAERILFDAGARRQLPVHVALGIRLLDGQPVSLFRSLIPVGLAPDFAPALRQHGSITKALAFCGIDDYTRKSTSLTAVAADATQAGHLQCQRGEPLLRSDSVNIIAGGLVIEVGATWFRGDSIRLVVD